uniref:Uncharacterized protein n=1 Tax=Glossina austeni TaxID=7395 RepID=A0A1A9UFA4_GLOAU
MPSHLFTSSNGFREACFRHFQNNVLFLFQFQFQFLPIILSAADAQKWMFPHVSLGNETSTKVLRIVFDNQKVKLQQTVDIITVTADSLSSVLHNSSDMRKLFPKCVPRSPIVDQKHQLFFNSAPELVATSVKS